MNYILVTANRNYSSWSLRPWVLMKALDISFEDHIIYFASPEENHANFTQYSPNAMMPCLHHDQNSHKQVVWESLGIAEYLAEHHEGVWPKDLAARAWARSIAAEMHGGFHALRMICPMNIGVRAKIYTIDNPNDIIDDDVITPITPKKLTALNSDINRINAIWNEGLKRFGGPWLAGRTFTAADAFYAPVVYRFRTFGFVAEGPAHEWIQAMLELPAMLQWERQALAETMREQSHEDEIMEIARITEDHRAA